MSLDEFTVIPAVALPKGWAWRVYKDGNGSLGSPTGDWYFGYTEVPGDPQNSIEYRIYPHGCRRIFHGSFAELREYAEKYIAKKIMEE